MKKLNYIQFLEAPVTQVRTSIDEYRVTKVDLLTNTGYAWGMLLDDGSVVLRRLLRATRTSQITSSTVVRVPAHNVVCMIVADDQEEDWPLDHQPADDDPKPTPPAPKDETKVATPPAKKKARRGGKKAA